MKGLLDLIQGLPWYIYGLLFLIFLERFTPLGPKYMGYVPKWERKK